MGGRVRCQALSQLPEGSLDSSTCYSWDNPEPQLTVQAGGEKKKAGGGRGESEMNTYLETRAPRLAQSCRHRRGDLQKVLRTACGRERVALGPGSCCHDCRYP